MEFSIRKHMTFMGIEIDGPMDAFVEKLEAKGFTLVEKDVDNTTMRGTFTNELVDLNICCTALTKTVSCIYVRYPKHSLLGYNELKNTYKEKYTLRDEHCDFINDKKTQEAIFKTELGKIWVRDETELTSIEDLLLDSNIKFFNTYGHLFILYYDDFNTELRKQEKKDAIQNDI